MTPLLPHEDRARVRQALAEGFPPHGEDVVSLLDRLDALEAEQAALADCGRTGRDVGHCFGCVRCLKALLKDADESNESLKADCRKLERHLAVKFTVALDEAGREARPQGEGEQA